MIGPDYRAKTAYRVPGWLLSMMGKYGISREKYAARLLAAVGASGKFLDVGCGDGALLREVAGKFSGLAGIDLNADRVELAKKLGPAGAKLLAHDANRPLPFPDASFGAAASLVTLDWVYDLNLALSEIARVLTPGGTFVLEVSNLGFLPRRLAVLLGRYPHTSAYPFSAWKKMGWDASTCHLFTARELRKFLAEFGFETVTVGGTGMFWQIRSWWPSLLCGDLFFTCVKK